jgi:hypothetical protein
MTMAVTISVQEQLLKRLEDFPAAKNVVISRAINRTADWSRVRTLDAITDNLAIKRSDLDGRHRFGGVVATRANQNKLAATVKITGRRIPLFRFAGTPKKGPNRQGIAYRINAGGGREHLISNTFTAIMRSSHTGFYKRKSDGTKHVKIIARTGKRKGKTIWSEQPLIELYGPSIPHVASKQPSFQKLLDVDASARLDLNLTREVNFVLTGSSKGVGDA